MEGLRDLSGANPTYVGKRREALARDARSYIKNDIGLSWAGVGQEGSSRQLLVAVA